MGMVSVGDVRRKADVSNLTSLSGRTLWLFSPVVIGENPYVNNLRDFFSNVPSGGGGTEVGVNFPWRKGSNAGESAAKKFRDFSNQGGTPLGNLLIIGHGFGDEKICSGITSEQKNCFSADDVFKVASEKYNGSNTFWHAQDKIGPPRCWLTRSAIIHGVACNTGRSWAPNWSRRIARVGSTVKGAPGLIYAGPNPQNPRTIETYFSNTPEDVYLTPDEFLKSKHWSNFPGEA